MDERMKDVGWRVLHVSKNKDRNEKAYSKMNQEKEGNTISVKHLKMSEMY